MRKSDPLTGKPWWYLEDDWWEILKASLLGISLNLAFLAVAARAELGISFADPWLTALSLFLILVALTTVVALLSAGISAVALYRQRRDRKLGRNTEYHDR